MDISACCIPLARIQEHNFQSYARGLPDAAQAGMMLSREVFHPTPGPLQYFEVLLILVQMSLPQGVTPREAWSLDPQAPSPAVLTSASFIA